MKNLLLYGTTNYGKQLSSSDLNKFKELSQEFNIYIISQNKYENIENESVSIFYIKKTNNRYLNYIKFYFLNFINFYKIEKFKNIDIVSAKDPISAFIPVLIRKVSKLDYKLIIEHHGNYLNLLLNQRTFYFHKTITLISKSIEQFSYKNCDFIRGVHELEVSQIAEKYNSQSDAFTTSGRGLDYGLINPAETRKILGFLLETFWESKHIAMKPNSFGIARL